MRMGPAQGMARARAPGLGGITRVASAVDQHAAYDLRRRRDGTTTRICERGGAAVDFFCEGHDMFRLAAWMVEAGLPFDRLYIYEPSRPIHVSWVDASERKPVRLVWRVKRENGHALPLRVKFGEEGGWPEA